MHKKEDKQQNPNMPALQHTIAKRNEI